MVVYEHWFSDEFTLTAMDEAYDNAIDYFDRPTQRYKLSPVSFAELNKRLSAHVRFVDVTIDTASNEICCITYNGCRVCADNLVSNNCIILEDYQ